MSDFIGNAKEKQGQYGPYIELGFKKEDLELMLKNINPSGWCNVTLSTSQKGGKYMKLLPPRTEQGPTQSFPTNSDLPF